MTTAAFFAFTSRAFSVKYLGAVFVLALLPFFFSTAVWGKTDAALFAQIDALRQIADQIQIDGNGSDWNGIPLFPDPAGDAGGDSSRDIVGFAIAPRADAFLFLITTAGTPSQNNLSFYIDLDFVARSRYALSIGIAPSGALSVTVFQEENGSLSLTSVTAQVAFGSVVEVKILYSSLIQVLPLNMANSLTEPNFRPMVRARVQSYNGNQRVDIGPAVGSYRLVPTPYSLDLPTDASGTSVEFPMNGKWFLSQEGFTINRSHANVWAYDLHIRDFNGYRSSPPDSEELGDYYAFGRPVYATTTSQVLETFVSSPDGSPLFNPPPPTPPNNRVVLDFPNPGSVWLRLLHFKQFSVSVSAGDTVQRGQLLALVGDSGNSGGPHLHMQLQNGTNLSSSFPIALLNVRVSLNATPDDPWARDVAVWQAREAFFVERQVSLGKATADFDADGRSDIGIYRDGVWSIRRSSEGGTTTVGLGSASQNPVPADYDGDGKTDKAVYLDGIWTILRSTDDTVTVVNHGGSSFVAVPADYDGDGKADIAVYSDGVWSIIRSSDGGNTVVAHGGPGWIPVPADYDGDGKADIAVYINGAWSVKRSSDNVIAVFGHGGPSWKPVAADYDGDGKADIAVYTNGAWSVKRSSDNSIAVSGHGGPAWNPVPADYDGDGKADIAVYNSNGAWSIKKSSNNAIQVVGHGGGTTDVPLN